MKKKKIKYIYKISTYYKTKIDTISKEIYEIKTHIYKNYVWNEKAIVARIRFMKFK